MASNDRELSALKENFFDLLIVGGGINGSGIARDASLRGFKVCLIEKGDFASGTSSRTTKLVHGGLRYLEHGHFKLVYEALRERETLLRIAPHLVHPLSFLLPIYEHDPRGALWVKLGLSLYDGLAGRRKIKSHEGLSTEKFLQEVPSIKSQGLKKVFHYYDAQMNDARVALENILSAKENGAQCLNYIQALNFLEKDSRISGVLAEDLASGQKIEIRAKLVINATGPWADQLLAIRKKNHRRLRLTKGIHLVLPRLSPSHALLLSSQKDGRVFFSIPWGNYSLVGTTDTDFSGDPDDVHADPEDVRYLLEEIQRLFPVKSIKPQHVISTFAALRPLIRQAGSTTQVSREYRIDESIPGLVNILGGKFTTYRSLAERVVDRVSKILQLHQDQRCQTATSPLPGAGSIPETEELVRNFDIPLETSNHLIQTYGSRAVGVAQLAKEFQLKERICPNHPHLKAEVLYAFQHEMARTLEDFMTRRTSIRYNTCRGLDCLDSVAEILREFSSLSKEALEDQKTFYRQKVQEDLKVIAPA